MGARDISDRDYRRLIELLIARRRTAGLTQNDLIDALKKNQASISKLERFQRRLDVIDLVRYCDAIGADPLDIMREWLGRG